MEMKSGVNEFLCHLIGHTNYWGVVGRILPDYTEEINSLKNCRR
jgi:hypothetical protein